MYTIRLYIGGLTYQFPKHNLNILNGILEYFGGG